MSQFDVKPTLPKVKSFAVLFKNVQLYHCTNNPAVVTQHVVEGRASDNDRTKTTYHVEGLCTRYRQYYETVNGKKELRSTIIDSFVVTPTKVTLDVILKSMLGLHLDRISFRAIIRTDGTTSVYAKYSKIIGSRLLANVKSCTVRRACNGKSAWKMEEKKKQGKKKQRK